MNTKEALAWRYATLKFDTNREIPEEDLTYILESGNLAATAYGLQPFSFVVVTDQAKKDELIRAAYNQEHAGKNSALIVLAVRTDIDEAYITEYATCIETTRGFAPGTVDKFKESMIKGLGNKTPEERLIWAQKQAYIALGTLMVAASEKKIDNHAMEGFNPIEFNTILGLDARNLHATVILALGYRSSEDQTQNYAKVRKPLSDIVV